MSESKTSTVPYKWESLPELAIPVKPTDACRYVVFSVNDVYDLSLLPYLRTFITEYVNASNTDVHHVTMNGDFLSPSTLALFDKGRLMIQAMNELGCTHYCFGNHEFDIEWPELTKRIQECNAIFVNTNMSYELENSFGIAEKSYPYIHHTLPNGAKVTFTGYLTEETYTNMKIVQGDKPTSVSIYPVVDKALVDEANIAKGALLEVTEFPEEVKNNGQVKNFTTFGLKSETSAIPDMNARVKNEVNDTSDIQIMLTHQFIPYDREFACKSKHTDLILGGHEHEPFLETIVRDTSKDISVTVNSTTSTTMDGLVQGVRICKTGQDALFCSIAIFDIIPNTSDASVQVQVQTTAADSTSTNISTMVAKNTHTTMTVDIASSTASPAHDMPNGMSPQNIFLHSEAGVPLPPCIYKQTEKYTILQHVRLANVHKIEKFVPPNQVLLDIEAEAEEVIKQNGSRVVYTLPDGKTLSSRNVRAGPNDMAQFLADAIRAASGADACILPAGKVRGNKEYTEGYLKVIDIMSELPFLDNQCCVVNVTIAEIEYILDYSWTNNYGRGGFLQIDNLLQYDHETKKLKQINGIAIDANASPDTVYKVCIPLTHLKGMDNNPYLMNLGIKFNVFDLLVDDLPLLQHLVFRQLEKWQSKRVASTSTTA